MIQHTLNLKLSKSEIFNLVLYDISILLNRTTSKINNVLQYHTKIDSVIFSNSIPSRETKAGRFVGKASCYAVVVLADNATITLAVNRMVAFRTQSANRPLNWLSLATLALPVEHLPHNFVVVWSSPTRDRIFHMFVSTSAYAVGEELSYLGCSWEDNSHSAQL